MYERLEKLVNQYFEAFENKNIEVLEKIFHNDIVLFDPIVKKIKGKKQVLEINKNIFSNCTNIIFTRKDIFIDINKITAICELEFYCNDIKINVVDIIKFSQDFKIIGINAYLDSKIFG